jgi:tetratricopeptide (TPR) repeat protein
MIAMTIQEEITQLETRLQGTTGLKEQAEMLLQILQKYDTLNKKDSELHIERLRQLAIGLSSPEYIAWAHYYSYIAHRMTANFGEAIREAELALDIFTGLKHQSGISAAHNALGVIDNMTGTYNGALAHFRSSLATRLLMRQPDGEVGDRWGIAAVYSNMGMVHGNQGNYDDSISSYLTSLKIKKEIPDSRKKTLGAEYKASIGATYNNLAIQYYFRGMFTEAIENFLLSLKIREETGDKWGVASSYNNIASVYMEQGDYAEALSNYSALDFTSYDQVKKLNFRKKLICSNTPG